jgi:S-adenosyl-L-methionine hydrolase (adenosine-forming)
MESLTRSGIITLTTDFGLDDAYVGIVKATLLSIYPEARLVDISHNIAPQNIPEASYLLFTSVKYFPRATVHLAVVDPGVGSSRRPILVCSNGHFLVGPDNGILTDFLNDSARVYFLNRPQFFLSHLSHTFHARDVFAPVAAHLARGTEPEQMGELITDAVRLERPRPALEPSRILGTVIYIDRFGNMITNIKAEQLEDDSVVRVMGKDIQGISTSYSEKPKGTLLAVAGSSGFLEIALASDSAALRLKGAVGLAVEVRKAV